MKLEDALNATHAMPPAEERADLLKEQLASFRRDFYGHVTNIQRIEAWGEEHGELTPDLKTAKRTAEVSLDHVEGAINHVLSELAKLDPDTPQPQPNRAARRATKDKRK